MKKSFITIITALALGIGAMLTMSGCISYRSKPGKMEELVGTYQLTTYTCKDAEGEKYDMISTNEVSAYLVIGADGTGYYVYKDKETPLKYDTIGITYEYKTEQNEDGEYVDTDLIKNIKYVNGVSDISASQQHPGAGEEPTLGFDANNHSLNYSRSDSSYSITLFGQTSTITSKYTSVVYKRISTDTTLAKVASEMGVTFDALPQYEIKNLGETLLYSRSDNFVEYKYMFLKVNKIAKTADLYYERVTESSGHVEQNIAITFTKVSGTGYHTCMNITIKGVVYNLTSNASGVLASSIYCSHEGEYTEWFNKSYSSATTAEDLISELKLSYYNNIKSNAIELTSSNNTFIKADCVCGAGVKYFKFTVGADSGLTLTTIKLTETDNEESKVEAGLNVSACTLYGDDFTSVATLQYNSTTKDYTITDYKGNAGITSAETEQTYYIIVVMANPVVANVTVQ